MTALDTTFLLAIHVWIWLFYIELITLETLIALLYSSNIVLILVALKKEWFPSEDRSSKQVVLREIALKDIKQRTYALSPRGSIYRWPNMYIERWKTKYLERPAEYPLDRYAFLTAKYAPCAMDCCMQLKNSQLKQLAKKLGIASHELVLNELHPCKMVSEGFENYLLGRSSFYTKRNVVSVGGKQLTRPGKKLQFREIDGQELVAFQNFSPYSSVVDLMTRGHPCYNNSPSCEEDDDKKMRRMWRRIRRAVSR